MSRISVDVDVDIHDFDEDEVLKEALRIVKHETRSGREPYPDLVRHIEALRVALVPDYEPPEPRSTAAEINDWAALRELVEKNPTLYHFAGRA